MAIKKPVPKVGFEIDLDGVNGNVFQLMSIAKGLAKDIGIDGSKLISEMMSGTYEDAVRVFEREFGEYVTLRTTDESLIRAVDPEQNPLNSVRHLININCGHL